MLSQVASRADVSAGTVSRVFNNSKLIPAETRMRVIAAARALGFRPRIGVRRKQIALITEPPWKTVMGGYVNTLTQYICYALSRVNAGITIITEDRIDDITDSWFDGIVGIAWESATIGRLQKIKKIPIVWFSDNYADSFHVIYPDAVATGRMAGEYLLEKGHTKIAVIHETDYTGTGRVNGLKKAMEKRGIDAARRCRTFPDTMPLHLSVKQLIDDGCTAVWVTGEDMNVLEVNWLIQELAGKRVPDDISLLGFENPGISEFMRPSLTTIATPLKDMAEKAVEVVLQDNHESLVKIEMPVTIIERTSVKRLGSTK